MADTQAGTHPLVFLTELIKAEIDGSAALLTLIPGGIWLDSAEGEPDLAYMTMQLADEFTPDYEDTNGDVYQTQLMVFNVWADSPRGALNPLWRLEKLLRDNYLSWTWTGGAAAGVNRVGGSLAQDPDRGSDGEVIWHAVVSFHVHYTREMP